MTEATERTLYERRMAAGAGPWADVYGGATDNLEIREYHDGYWVDGIHHGQEVKNAIDFFHGVLCRIIRPDHPRLVEARKKAAETGVSHIGKTHLHESIVGLMERLKRSYDALGIGPGRVLLATTGSGANSMAYNMAHVYTGGGEIMGLERNYHGNDYQGKGLVNAPGWPGAYPPEIPNRHNIRRHYPHGDPAKTGEHLSVLRHDLETLRSHGVRPIDYFEDIQGVGGSFANPGEEYLTGVMELMDEFDGVAVDDNVQSGMRRGHYLSVPKWLLRKPKNPLLFVTLAKALGNGAPIAAVLAPEAIVKDMEADAKFAASQGTPTRYGLHWDTYAEQVKTAEEASGVYDVYHEKELGKRTPQVRETFLEEVKPLVDAKKGPIIEVRGDGLMIGLALKDPKLTIAKAVGIAPQFGVIIGKGADALRIAPLADTPLELVKEGGQRVAKLIGSLYGQ